jgi:hypothetical protein
MSAPRDFDRSLSLFDNDHFYIMSALRCLRADAIGNVSKARIADDRDLEAAWSRIESKLDDLIGRLDD